MKRIKIICSSLAILGCLLASGIYSAQGAEGLSNSARSIVEKHKDSIVLVEVVLNMEITYGGQSRKREQKLEVNGTVINSEGLVLIANSSIDPSANARARGLKVNTSTTSVKIVLADGTEHEATVALTDKDLDLAFVQPKTKIKLPFLALKKTVAPKLLDDMISITRLDRKANREPGVALSKVMSIIRKPRVRYLAGGSIFPACPVFNAGGEILGVALRRSGTNSYAVLPSEDILEIVAQVPAAGEAATPVEKPVE